MSDGADLPRIDGEHPHTPLLQRSHEFLRGAQARFERIVVTNTRAGKAEMLDGTIKSGFGDGIMIYPNPMSKALQGGLHLSDSLVQDSARAGVLYHKSGGSIQRTVLRRGKLGLVLDKAGPAVGEDNVYEDNYDDRISFTSDLAVPKPLKLPAPP